jgi:hypothetical protein
MAQLGPKGWSICSGLVGLTAIAMWIGLFGRAGAVDQRSEAEVAAQTVWNGIVTRCGNHWFAGTIKPEVVMGAAGATVASTSTLVEYQRVTVGVTPNHLDEADALNGLEWSGAAELKGGFYRSHLSLEGEKWGDWQSANGTQLFVLRKQRGVWAFAFVDPTGWTGDYLTVKEYGLLGHKHLSCDAIAALR